MRGAVGTKGHGACRRRAIAPDCPSRAPEPQLSFAMSFTLHHVIPSVTRDRIRHVRHDARFVRAAASQDVDLSRSGLKYLSDAARERATAKKANKFEKVKVQKCGSRMWTEVYELSQLIREGKTTWEELDLDDIDIRMKWAGLFHRRKRVPGTFMMRIKVLRLTH